MGVLLALEGNFTSDPLAGRGQDGKNGVLHGVVARREVVSGAAYKVVPLRVHLLPAPGTSGIRLRDEGRPSHHFRPMRYSSMEKIAPDVGDGRAVIHVNPNPYLCSRSRAW